MVVPALLGLSRALQGDSASHRKRSLELFGETTEGGRSWGSGGGGGGEGGGSGGGGGEGGMSLTEEQGKSLLKQVRRSLASLSGPSDEIIVSLPTLQLRNIFDNYVDIIQLISPSQIYERRIPR